MNKRLKWAALTAISVVLSACGGGGDGGSTPVTPGPEAWVAGEYISECSASPVGGVVSSSSSDFIVSEAGVYTTRMLIYAGTTQCAGQPLAVLRYPAGQLATASSQTMTVGGFGAVTVRKVNASEPAGQVTVSGDAGYITVTGTTITVRDPNSVNVLVQVDRATTAYTGKDLMLVRNNRLYFGVDAPLDADGYPTAIDTSYSIGKV